MKKSSVISILTAAALVSVNSALAAFAFADNTPDVTAPASQEFDVSPEEEKAIENIRSSTNEAFHQYTMIPSDSVMEDEAIDIAKKNITETFHVQLDHYTAMAVAAGTAEMSEPDWFVTLAPKNITKNAAAVYTVRVDSENGDVISAQSSETN